ncbi:hypothetical protein PVAP13_9NG583428 [Panicum virgatum]|uniref:cytokinin riboside 5'-monophosphate phosphoribohydrolase n=1 Tax=Panicum virgatum TaxID=38727 RepID=A0A8T0N0R3_PANVG|nr:hypothetical protein PVAP13_9NG583428 [Panicum virgatum]
MQVPRGVDLVYGVGGIGLMGLVSVIPRRTLMASPEVVVETVGEVVRVAGMHQRKAEMARQSDAFVALPGGYGTLEELLEVGLLNVDGYYDSLLAFIDRAVEEGFVSPGARGIVVQAPTAQHLMAKLEEYVPYYDRVASGLNWEATRAAVVGKDAAGAGSPGVSVSGI